MIKYDKPRTWWLTDLQDDGPIPVSVIAKSDTHLVMAGGSQDQIKGSYWEYFESREQAEAVITKRITREKATAAAEARIKTCLAACDGVDHLTPGCVAKLVEALERIRETYSMACFADEIKGMNRWANAALAAMKGA